MSLILDALNRSRQDSEQVPGLASHHLADGAVAGTSGGIGWVQWLLVSGLALAVLVIGWLLFDRTPPTVTVLERPAVDRATVPMQEDHVAVLPVPGRSQTAGREQEEISAPPPAPAPVVKEEPQIAQALPQVEPASPVVDASVAALYRQQEQHAANEPAVTKPGVGQSPAEVPEPTGTDEEALDIQQLVAKAEAELADSRLQDNGVPFLATLSQQTKDAIPTLMYQRHDYSGMSAKSSVLINGKTLRAGASVGGVKVEEILPDSVVLDFKGTRFRLRALNSWVNL